MLGIARNKISTRAVRNGVDVGRHPTFCRMSARASPPTYLCTPAIAPAYASPNDPDNPRCIQAIRGDEGCTALGARQVRWEMPCLHAHSFDSPASTKRALNEYAQHHGYGLVTTSTYRDKYGDVRRVVFGCDRHGVKRTHYIPPPAVRRRNAASRNCNCQMKVCVVRVSGDSCTTTLHPTTRRRILSIVAMR